MQDSYGPLLDLGRNLLLLNGNKQLGHSPFEFHGEQNFQNSSFEAVSR